MLVPPKWRKVMTGVERPYPELRATAHTLRARALVIGCALVLALIYAATLQLQPTAASPALSGRCNMQQKRRLFVGFAPGGGLNGFEPAAIASRDILGAVKRWLCESRELSAGHTPSLRQALHDQRALRAERIMFDDVALSRAHLELAQLGQGRAAQPGERGWHVHVARGPQGWGVSHASDQRLTQHD